MFEPQGFVFEPGVDQIMGKTASGTANLQILGNPADVQSTGLMMGGAQDPVEVARLMGFTIDLVRTAMPQWKDGPKWIVKALGKGKNATIQKGAVELSLNIHPELGGIIIVTVRRPSAEDE